MTLLNYYFDTPFGDIEWLYKQREWSLNQVEYVAKKVNLHYKFLCDKIGASGITVSNFMMYGIDAVFKHPSIWRGSKSRIAIIKTLHEAIHKE